MFQLKILLFLLFLPTDVFMNVLKEPKMTQIFVLFLWHLVQKVLQSSDSCCTPRITAKLDNYLNRLTQSCSIRELHTCTRELLQEKVRRERNVLKILCTSGTFQRKSQKIISAIGYHVSANSSIILLFPVRFLCITKEKFRAKIN